MKALITIFVSIGVGIASSFAHCDTMNGPVVKAAREALRTNNVNLVLIWVQKSDEEAIRTAFQKTVEVRGLSPLVRQMADAYFFETLVRIHRAGEGEPYTGLKDSTDVAKPIAAVERALKDGSVNVVLLMLNDAMASGVGEKFSLAMESKDYRIDDVAAGRIYVARYVALMHYVEALYDAAEHPAMHDHHPAAGSVAEKHSESHGDSAHEEYAGIHDDHFFIYILIIASPMLIVITQIMIGRRKAIRSV